MFIDTHVPVLKNFFGGQRLYTSAVAMVTQVHDRAKTQDWLKSNKGGGKLGDLSGEIQRGVRDTARHKDN